MKIIPTVHTKNIHTKLIIWLLILFILPTVTYSQTVSNVTAEQVDKNIHVSYDLDMQSEISLHLSIDGGKTYTQLYKVSGDVGKNITEGHKTIIWDVLAERENLVGDEVLFKVKAEQSENLYFTVNGVTFKMIYVDGGTFTMGCTPEQGRDCLDDEKPSHSVELDDFYIGETEVTQALWKAVMGSEPTYNDGWETKYGRGDSYPAYLISWNECKVFIEKLNQYTEKKFRLPTESEWEYAARGGSISRHYKYSGSDHLKEVAWYYPKSNSTHLVKTKSPNELGIYDMSGNVWEWCEDWYYRYDNSVQTNYTGSATLLQRVVRGGSWFNEAWYSRVSYRGFLNPNDRKYSVGFRLALDHK